MLTGRVFPLVRDPGNVLSAEEVTFLHDNACFNDLWTGVSKSVLISSQVNFQVGPLTLMC